MTLDDLVMCIYCIYCKKACRTFSNSYIISISALVTTCLVISEHLFIHCSLCFHQKHEVRKAAAARKRAKKKRQKEKKQALI